MKKALKTLLLVLPLFAMASCGQSNPDSGNQTPDSPIVKPDIDNPTPTPKPDDGEKDPETPDDGSTVLSEEEISNHFKEMINFEAKYKGTQSIVRKDLTKEGADSIHSFINFDKENSILEAKIVDDETRNETFLLAKKNEEGRLIKYTSSTGSDLQAPCYVSEDALPYLKLQLAKNMDIMELIDFRHVDIKNVSKIFKENFDTANNVSTKYFVLKDGKTYKILVEATLNESKATLEIIFKDDSLMKITCSANGDLSDYGDRKDQIIFARGIAPDAHIYDGYVSQFERFDVLPQETTKFTLLNPDNETDNIFGDIFLDNGILKLPESVLNLGGKLYLDKECTNPVPLDEARIPDSLNIDVFLKITPESGSSIIAKIVKDDVNNTIELVDVESVTSSYDLSTRLKSVQKSGYTFLLDPDTLIDGESTYVAPFSDFTFQNNKVYMMYHDKNIKVEATYDPTSIYIDYDNNEYYEITDIETYKIHLMNAVVKYREDLKKGNITLNSAETFYTLRKNTDGLYPYTEQTQLSSKHYNSATQRVTLKDETIINNMVDNTSTTSTIMDVYDFSLETPKQYTETNDTSGNKTYVGETNETLDTLYPNDMNNVPDTNLKLNETTYEEMFRVYQEYIDRNSIYSVKYVRCANEEAYALIFRSEDNSKCRYSDYVTFFNEDGIIRTKILISNPLSKNKDEAIDYATHGITEYYFETTPEMDYTDPFPEDTVQ